MVEGYILAKLITNNQRLVYKIHSSRLRYYNWNISMDLIEAKKNDELVHLGDSKVLRMIREIRGESTSEKEIGKLKKNIKNIKRMSLNRENKLKIKELYEELTKKTLVDDYLMIIFDSISDWNIANSKKTDVIINNKKYVRLLGTSGGIKKNIVVFVAEDIHEELNTRLNNGRDLSKKYVPAKFEAYKSLACSSSAIITQPNRVLVIKDGLVKFKSDILRLSDNGNGGFDLSEVDGYEIEKPFTDGCGMISPKLSKQWTFDLTGGYYKDEDGNDVGSSGYNIRNSWTKGMVFTFPFSEYADSIGEYQVEDFWGNYVDIRDVDLIITDNMFKLADAYTSIEHYLECCRQNGFDFSVSKILPEKLENTRNMNYQFLQSYEMTDDDIYDLIKPTVDMINGAVGYSEQDYAKMLLFLKGNNTTENDFIKEEIAYIKALMIEPMLMQDPLVKNRVYNMIKKKMDDSKKGVIQVKGNYQIVSGDLYALCQHMFKKEITGLLGQGEFYSKAWTDKGVDKVVAYRSPMTIKNNIVSMKLMNNDEVKRWYRYMTTCIVLNAWDTTMEAMNGMDFDGDAIITTNNDVLLRKTQNLKTVVCEQKSVPKQIITEKLLRDSNKMGFGNDVGSITNRCTAMFDILAKFEKDSKEYKEMVYRITCMQGYQQEVIDSCKGIVPKKVPKIWYDSKAVRISDDDTEEEIKLKKENEILLANKKPYFFIYNYSHIKNAYNTHIKNNNENCIKTQGKTLNQLLGQAELTEVEAEFLKWFEKLSPISNNGSTMNRICNMLEEEFDGIRNHVKKSDFDCKVLTTNKPIKRSVEDEVMEVYEEYKARTYEFMKANCSASKEEKNDARALFVENFKEKVYSICNNSEDLTNILVNNIYKNQSSSKSFVWDMVGDSIVEKLLADNDYYINVPVEDDNGDIEWLGSKYTLKKIKVGVE